MQDIEDLLSIWEQRLEVGQEITPEELCRDCPDLLPEVQRQIRAMRALQPVESYFGRTSSRKESDTKPDAERIRKLIDLLINVTTGYQIERHHASGGLGDVFVAVDPVLNRRVAVKFPRTARMSPEQRMRFEREARVTGRLDHPGIVAVHALKQDDADQSCYVMRFVEGPTLNDRCKELHCRWDEQRNTNRFASMEFRRLLEQFVTLCDIVAYAHTQGVIHRDIKPANVILGPFGEVLLMDWGLARVEGESTVNEIFDPIAANSGGETTDPKENSVRSSPVEITKSGQLLGTPAFAAPEQLLGRLSQVDHRSDVFSLGATLFFLFKGRVPVERSAMPQHLERISSSVDSPFSIDLDVPRTLAAICKSSTAVKPEMRYQSVVELADDIRRYLANEPVKVVRDTITARAFRWVRNNPTRSAAIAVSTIMMLLFSSIGLLLMSQFNQRLEASYQELSSAKKELETSIEAESLARSQAETNLNAATSAVKKYLVTIAEDEMLKVHDFSDLRRTLLTSASPYFELLRDQKPGNLVVDENRTQALHSLGEVQLELENYAEALSSFTECIETLEAMSRSHPENLMLHKGLSQALVSCGNVLMRQGKREEAKTFYQRATELRETLVQKDPVFRNELAEIYGINGRIALEDGEKAIGDETLAEAIEIGEQLRSEDSSDPKVRERLANDLISLGRSTVNKKRVEAAVAIYDQLAEEFPKIPNYRFLQALGRKSMVTWLEVEEKFKTFEQLIATQAKLSSDFPSIPSYQIALAESHHSFAAQLFYNDHLAKAAQQFENAMNIRKRLYEKYPESSAFARDLGGSYCALGTTANLNKDPQAALQWFLSSEHVLRENLERSPNDRQVINFLSQTYSGKAKSLVCLGRFDDSIADWIEAAKLDLGDMKEFYLQREVDVLELANRMEEATGSREANSAADHLALAKFCAEKERFRLAAAEYWIAFHLDPKLAEGNRVAAARCAGLVLANKSKEAQPTVSITYPDFRSWALLWLGDEFQALKSQPNGKEQFAKWLRDESLASVRDETSIEIMPEDESGPWKEFWANLRTALETK